MKKVKILRAVIIILLAADMLMIFSFSHQRAEASDGTSGGLIESIVRLVHSDFDFWSEEKQNETVQKYQHLVRKAAHMTEFASLGALACAFACTFGLKAKNLLFAFLFGALYAVSDEIHQLFIPGRSGQLSDVMIDSTGVLLGVAVFYVIVKIFGAIIKKRKKKKAAEAL